MGIDLIALYQQLPTLYQVFQCFDSESQQPVHSSVLEAVEDVRNILEPYRNEYPDLLSFEEYYREHAPPNGKAWSIYRALMRPSAIEDAVSKETTGSELFKWIPEERGDCHRCAGSGKLFDPNRVQKTIVPGHYRWHESMAVNPVDALLYRPPMVEVIHNGFSPCPTAVDAAITGCVKARRQSTACTGIVEFQAVRQRVWSAGTPGDSRLGRLSMRLHAESSTCGMLSDHAPPKLDSVIEFDCGPCSIAFIVRQSKRTVEEQIST